MTKDYENNPYDQWVATAASGLATALILADDELRHVSDRRHWELMNMLAKIMVEAADKWLSNPENAPERLLNLADENEPQ